VCHGLALGDVVRSRKSRLQRFLDLRVLDFVEAKKLDLGGRCVMITGSGRLAVALMNFYQAGGWECGPDP
jgi:hypothetical protein